jgi:hypothetical protein
MRSRASTGILAGRQGALDFEVRYKSEFSGWPSERLARRRSEGAKKGGTRKVRRSLQRVFRR